MVDALEAFVDGLGLAPFHLIGYSMGAMTALGFTVRAPERLGTLVVVGITAAREPLTFLARAARRYGDVGEFCLGGGRAVLLAHPDDIRDVLVTHVLDAEPDLGDRQPGFSPLRDEQQGLGVAVVAELHEEIGLVQTATLLAARKGLPHAVEPLCHERDQRRCPSRRGDRVSMLVPPGAVRRPTAREVDARAGVAVFVKEDQPPRRHVIGERQARAVDAAGRQSRHASHHAGSRGRAR